MSRVVVVGSFNQDHVWRSERFPQPGETRLGLFSCGPGGKGFNQAVAAARLGAETWFLGALGRVLKDRLGGLPVDQGGKGIETRVGHGCPFRPVATGCLFCVPAEQGFACPLVTNMLLECC